MADLEELWDVLERGVRHRFIRMLRSVEVDLELESQSTETL